MTCLLRQQPAAGNNQTRPWQLGTLTHCWRCTSWCSTAGSPCGRTTSTASARLCCTYPSTAPGGRLTTGCRSAFHLKRDLLHSAAVASMLRRTRQQCKWIRPSQCLHQRMSTIDAGHWQGPHGLFCAAGNIRDPRGPQHSRHQPAPAAVRVCTGAPAAARHPGVQRSRCHSRQGRRSAL